MEVVRMGMDLYPGDLEGFAGEKEEKKVYRVWAGNGCKRCIVLSVLNVTGIKGTMDITKDQQVALDEALVPHASRLGIGKIHHHSICFKMNNKKRIVNLEYFREMLQISPRIPNQQFDELPFEEEILAFLRELGHSGEIKMITDVNINKLHQPWRSFAAVIKNCPSGKSIGYDSLRLSQDEILWGMYHKKNVDFAYLLWEDFVYQVEHKDAKESNEMYYPRFIKVIINFFMIKDQSIPRRNKYGVILPIELTNEAIRNSESYKEYYAIASRAEPPKIKESVRKKQSSSDTIVPPPTKGKRLKISAKTRSSFETTITLPAASAGPRLTTFEKDKQAAKASKAKSLSALSEVAMTDAKQLKLVTKRSLQQTHISPASGSGADEGLLIQIMSKSVIYIFRPLNVLIITKCKEIMIKLNI
nr:hypothetical protein [Tanacetum cinerariifolium]